METDKPKIELKWGETPFTHMTRQQLERAAQMLYSALSSAHCTLNQYWVVNQKMQSSGHNNPYWSDKGSGGKSFLKVNAAKEAITGPYNSSTIYRSFFRYADDLLFPELIAENDWPWRVCPKCGQMLASHPTSDSLGRQCGSILPHAKPDVPQCDGEFRPITWDDLKTEKQKAKEQKKSEPKELK